jgi:cold shock CspA family protein
MRGTVERLVKERGFAFLRGDGEPRASVFLHIHDVDPSLPFDETLLGKCVTWEEEMGPKGRRARYVQVEQGK